MKKNKVQYDYSKLLGRMREKGVTQEDLAAKLRMNTSTLNRKLNNTCDFRQSEIFCIMECLDISGEDIKAYFFTHLLAISQAKKQS